MRKHALTAFKCVVLLALACAIPYVVSTFVAPPPAEAQGWSSVNELKGQYFNADWVVAEADTMLRWPLSDVGGLAATGTPTASHRWWFFSFSVPCTMSVYSRDGAAYPVRTLTHTTGAGSLVLPGFKSGIDSVRIESAAGVTFAVWTMD